ncbi:lipid II flippase MurJ [Uliginosibacterium sp. 31-16]|uniref:lipid II flippase MurJ n=1 Tax=Uliginosibacterium sp. 31-16 TaxID=3068315 RepID=UPI00273EDF4F|nr:lipid II flippase MurJ [Uliginosibacterium sp. 31-16]MDP5238384.1 lipid II flippase MurJ [Uliginosibacterium sp. 31-16]
MKTSPGRSILRGMLWVSGFVFLAKLAGAFKEMAVAAGFGTGPVVDGYLVAFNVVNYPVALALGVVSLVLVPLAARAQGAPEADLRRFHGELLGWTLLAGLLIGAGVVLCAPLLPVLVKGQGGLMGQEMLRTLALVVPFGLVSSLLASWMLAAGRHLNTLLEAVPSLLLLLALLVAGSRVEVLVWGTIAGFVCQTVFFSVLLGRGAGLARPRLSLRAPLWVDFRRGLGIMIFGQALTALLPMLDQFFCGSLGEGAISTLGYASRIMALILGLGATSLGRASLPVLSAMVAGGGDLRGGLLRWTAMIVAAGALLALLAALFAPVGVQVLFERGAFSAQDTRQVSEVLRWSLLQLPVYFLSTFFSMVLAARQQHGVIVAITAAAIVAKCLAYLALVDWLGVRGVVLSSAVMYGVVVVLQGWVCLGRGRK